MQLVRTVAKAKEIARGWKRAGQSIGLVPTMGCLHEGHASLIERARAENDRVVVSIFVNPTQFAPGEDLDRYPRDLDHDCALCEQLGVNLVFHPDAGDMYRDPFAYVGIDFLSTTMEGAARPAHFRGVCTVVSKLFNIVAPDRAYFGQKDAQQLAIVKKLVADLNFDVEVLACPIVREEDGLAKSSRNVYLSPAERAAAPVLHRALECGRALIGPHAVATEVEERIKAVLAEEPLAQIDYVTCVDALTMQPIETVERPVLVAMAVRIGPVRLIDNFAYDPESA